MCFRNLMAGAALAGFVFCACAGEVGRSTPKGFTDDFDAAKAEAAKSGRKILAVFSGSDWCHWCKVLERDYLSKPEFVEAAGKDFVLVFIDNPQDRSALSENAKRRNAELTEQYGVRGFPTVKILDADGSEFAESRPGPGASPRDYAERLRLEAASGPLVKRHLKPFEDEVEDLMKATRWR